MYFPHNLDFRGRAYPMHPHLNHLGGDVNRGLLQFADAKPLGPSGLKWLKVSVSAALHRVSVVLLLVLQECTSRQRAPGESARSHTCEFSASTCEAAWVTPYCHSSPGSVFLCIIPLLHVALCCVVCRWPICLAGALTSWPSQGRMGGNNLLMTTSGRSWTQLMIPLVGRGEARMPVIVVQLHLLGARGAARACRSHSKLLTHM